jgi:hypothetical protein
VGPLHLATAGSHVIEATYSGDSTYAASTGTVTVTVGTSTSSSTETFTLSATNLTVSAGSSGTSTITVTPKNGYTGTIDWTVSADSSSLSNSCYSLSATTVSGTSAVTASMTIYTTASDCSSTSVTGTSGGKHKFATTNRSALRIDTPSGAILKGTTCRYHHGGTAIRLSIRIPLRRATGIRRTYSPGCDRRVGIGLW